MNAGTLRALGDAVARLGSAMDNLSARGKAKMLADETMVPYGTCRRYVSLHLNTDETSQESEVKIAALADMGPDDQPPLPGPLHSEGLGGPELVQAEPRYWTKLSHNAVGFNRYASSCAGCSEAVDVGVGVLTQYRSELGERAPVWCPSCWSTVGLYAEVEQVFSEVRS